MELPSSSPPKTLNIASQWCTASVVLLYTQTYRIGLRETVANQARGGGEQILDAQPYHATERDTCVCELFFDYAVVLVPVHPSAGVWTPALLQVLLSTCTTSHSHVDKHLGKKN